MLAQLDMGRVSDCYVSWDGRLVATLDADGVFRLWEVDGETKEAALYCGPNHYHPVAVEQFLTSSGLSKDETREKTHALFSYLDNVATSHSNLCEVVFLGISLEAKLDKDSLIMPVLIGEWLGGIWNFADSSMWEVSHYQISPNASYISNDGTRLVCVTNDNLHLYEVGKQRATFLAKAEKLPSFSSKDGRFYAYRTKMNEIIIADASARKVLARHSIRKFLDPTLSANGTSHIKSPTKARVGDSPQVEWSFYSNNEYVMIIVNHRKAILYDVMNNESVILEQEQDVLDFESRGKRESWTEVSLSGYRLDVDDSDDGLIRIFDPSTNKKVDTIRMLRGIDLTGLDLSMATMADNDRKVLRQNGAEVG